MAEGITLENAQFLASKLNKAISEYEMSIPSEKGLLELHVTVSIGISWFDKKDSSAEEALKRADSAQYESKAQGKNCARIILAD